MKFDNYLINEGKYSKSKIQKMVDAASMDFWSRIAEFVPEAKTGDLPPDVSVALTNAMEKAVAKWIEYNTK